MKVTGGSTRIKAMAITLGLALAALLAASAGTGAADQTSATAAQQQGAQSGAAASADTIKAPHGGQLTVTKSHEFETLYAADGIRVYMYSSDLSPEMAAQGGGKLTLKLADGSIRELPLVAQKPKEGEKTLYFCPMHKDVVQTNPGVCTQCGGMKLYAQDHLYARTDLSGVAPETVQAFISIAGLKGSEPKATFTVTFPAAKPAAQDAQKS